MAEGRTGANTWLVEEMSEQSVRDPSSINESWQELFADVRSGTPDRQTVPNRALRFSIIHRVPQRS